MELIIATVVLALFSILSFWKDYAVLYLVTAGIAGFNGFTWFDTYVDNLSLAISLCLIAYAFFCIGKAYASIFMRSGSDED